jgi:DNA gyrase subunit B
MSREEPKSDRDLIPLMNKLEKRAFVLSHPEMFIGRQWDSDGLYFLLFVVMESAIDPKHSNQCSALNMVIESESILVVSDNGCGLPVELTRIDQSVELPKIEHVFSWPFTTNPLPAYYKKFGFLNYLGFVLNAVSGRLLVETYFEGQGYALTCAQGEIIKHLKPVGADGIQKGTRLTITPDLAVFPDFKFDFESLETRLRDLKRAFPTITMTLEDKSTNRKIEIQIPA